MSVLRDLFCLPDISSPIFQEISQYIDEHSPEILAFFPHLSAEILHEVGPENGLEMISQQASRRVTRQQLFDLANASENKDFKHLDAEFLEFQSASGVLESLRRHSIVSLIKNGGKSAEIACSTGVSVRTVQRIRNTCA